jgi:HAE1 family hydrophobic/amphiphilic exporter-1
MAAMLLITGDTINIMSLIGLIMLMGLVTKNAILLVDCAKGLRSRGQERRQALIDAGRLRLRPILMTTTAMIFGMLPLALGLGSAGEVRAPMARTIVGGLITSTLLTLLVVPVFYTVLEDLGRWVRRRWLGKEAEAGRESPRAVSGKAALLAGAILALCSARAEPAAASEAMKESEGKVLTLEQALALATEQNRDIQRALEYQNWVKGRYVDERAAALPQLLITGSAGRQYDESQQDFYKGFPEQFGGLFSFEKDVATTDITLSQALFTWGQIGAAIRAAKGGLAIADDQFRFYRQGVLRDVSARFYDVLLAKELLAIAAENLDQKQRHLDAARRRLSAGTATDYDVLAAEVDVENARPELIRADNLLRNTKERLNFLLGREGGALDVEGTLITTVAPYPAYSDVLERALQNRPEVHELSHRRQVSEEVVKVVRAGDKPRLDLQAGYGWRGYDTEDLDSDGEAWNAGLLLSFPVFDGLRTRGKVAQAKSDVRSAEIGEAKLRDAIFLEARASVDAVQEAGEILKALSGTVTQAERLLFMAEMGYENGVKTRLDVQDAQFNLLSARGSLARARRDYQVSLVNLDWVAGTLGEEPPR